MVVDGRTCQPAAGHYRIARGHADTRHHATAGERRFWPARTGNRGPAVPDDRSNRPAPPPDSVRDAQDRAASRSSGGADDSATRSRRVSRLSPKVRRTFGALLLAMTIAAMDYTIVSAALPTIVGEMGALTLLPLGSHRQRAGVDGHGSALRQAVRPLRSAEADAGRHRAVHPWVRARGAASAGASDRSSHAEPSRAPEAAGLISLSYMIVGDLIAPRQRGRYQAYISAVFTVSSFFGPLVGGLAVDHFSWRLAFYPSVLLALIALVVIRRNLTDPPPTRGVAVDWLGAALLSLGPGRVLARRHLGWTRACVGLTGDRPDGGRRSGGAAMFREAGGKSGSPDPAPVPVPEPRVHRRQRDQLHRRLRSLPPAGLFPRLPSDLAGNVRHQFRAPSDADAHRILRGKPRLGSDRGPAGVATAGRSWRGACSSEWDWRY